ncbi:hypothetical protein EVAR_57112_1 [Eumeta japonica]|uniref:Uncharacterized protein n=1 Tax=Eumeta variegata TaxID=151549 RepID=A0A4C1SGM4_EUMVA|nr:hypothetical protein EVAR_57112_1 [Eumeta japonica]
MYIDVVSAVRRENKLRHSGLKTTARNKFATNVTVVKVAPGMLGDKVVLTRVWSVRCRKVRYQDLADQIRFRFSSRLPESRRTYDWVNICCLSSPVVFSDAKCISCTRGNEETTIPPPLTFEEFRRFLTNSIPLIL